MSTLYLYTSETKLLKQVKADLDRHEGFREFAYPDPLSELFRKNKKVKWGYYPARDLMPAGTSWSSGAPWTVGFGFTHNVTVDSKISRITAERMLEDLILRMNALLPTPFPWYKDATLVTKTVIINMAFNMGVKGLMGFKNTMRMVSEKNYVKAAQNMKLSLWYNQVGVRAQELVKRMATQSIEPQHIPK